MARIGKFGADFPFEICRRGGYIMVNLQRWLCRFTACLCWLPRPILGCWPLRTASRYKSSAHRYSYTLYSILIFIAGTASVFKLLPVQCTVQYTQYVYVLIYCCVNACAKSFADINLLLYSSINIKFWFFAKNNILLPLFKNVFVLGLGLHSTYTRLCLTCGWAK